MIAGLRERAGEERLRRRTERATGAVIHRSVHIRGWDRLELGAGAMIDSGAVLHCGGMDWSQGRGRIAIGANAYIGPNCVLFGAGGIEIGASALISPGVVITSQQHTFSDRDAEIRDQPLQLAAVTIERDVWLGANATILPGVRIGQGSVVGAGAVVSRDVDPLTVVLGVPARVARER